MPIHKTVRESILEKWQSLAAEMTGIDFLGGADVKAAQAVALRGLDIARAQASGNEGAIRRALQAQIAFDKAKAAELEKLPKTVERVKTLTQLYQDQASAQSALESMNKKAVKTTEAQTAAGKKQSAANQAHTAELKKVKDAAGKLVDKYKELEQVNKQAFAIFSGPISQGPIAQIYDNINQMLMGFGRKPIAIPVKLQIQDIQTQTQNFSRFIEDLTVLRKRGLPAKLIEELQAKGPTEGLPIVEGLRNASSGAINQYVKLWNDGQTLIKTSTALQMNQTLKQWQKMGKGIAFQIIQGLASDTSQAILRKGYEKYITNTFKGVLNKEFNESVDKKVKDFQKVQAAKGKKSGTTATKPEPTRTTQSTTTIHHHGDEVKIIASGATSSAVKTAIDRSAHEKRHRR